MSILALIAERRIQEAIRNGELDDLALKGQPLPNEDLSHIPEELRAGYKILKNAGYLPEELQLQQELLTLRGLVAQCADPEKKKEAERKLSLRQLQYDLLMERNGRQVGYQEYAEQLTRRLTGKAGRQG